MRTPRTGTAITHRVALVLDADRPRPAGERLGRTGRRRRGPRPSRGSTPGRRGLLGPATGVDVVVAELDGRRRRGGRAPRAARRPWRCRRSTWCGSAATPAPPASWRSARYAAAVPVPDAAPPAAAPRPRSAADRPGSAQPRPTCSSWRRRAAPADRRRPAARRSRPAAGARRSRPARRPRRAGGAGRRRAAGARRSAATRSASLLDDAGRDGRRATGGRWPRSPGSASRPGSTRSPAATTTRAAGIGRGCRGRRRVFADVDPPARRRRTRGDGARRRARSRPPGPTAAPAAGGVRSGLRRRPGVHGRDRADLDAAASHRPRCSAGDPLAALHVGHPDGAGAARPRPDDDGLPPGRGARHRVRRSTSAVAQVPHAGDRPWVGLTLTDGGRARTGCASIVLAGRRRASTSPVRSPACWSTSGPRSCRAGPRPPGWRSATTRRTRWLRRRCCSPCRPTPAKPWTVGRLNQVLLETLDLAHLRARRAASRSTPSGTTCRRRCWRSTSTATPCPPIPTRSSAAAG